MTPDATLLHWITIHRCAPLGPVVLFFTHWTGEEQVIEGALLVAVILGLRGRWKSAGVLFFGTSIGIMLTNGIKSLIHRARPPGIHIHSMSFPSGHAMGSMIFFSLAAWLAMQRRPGHNALFISAATVLILFSGYCRLYLGVHWPSDVLGGFILGGLFTWVWIWLVKKIP